MHKEDLIAKLDLIPAEIIKSDQNYYLLFLYIGVILFIVLICYYYFKQRQLLKILKLIKKFETKPDFKIFFGLISGFVCRTYLFFNFLLSKLHFSSV